MGMPPPCDCIWVPENPEKKGMGAGLQVVWADVVAAKSRYGRWLEGVHPEVRSPPRGQPETGKHLEVEEQPDAGEQLEAGRQARNLRLMTKEVKLRAALLPAAVAARAPVHTSEEMSS